MDARFVQFAGVGDPKSPNTAATPAYRWRVIDPVSGVWASQEGTLVDHTGCSAALHRITWMLWTYLQYADSEGFRDAPRTGASG